MKKVTLLCQADDQPETLSSLRDLGVLHLEHVKEPEGADLDQARAGLNQATTALNLLEDYDSTEESPASQSSPQQIIDRTCELSDSKKRLFDGREALSLELANQEAFGDFDPELIRTIAAKGVIVKLCKCSKKQTVSAPENTELHLLSTDSDGQVFALTSLDDFECPADEFPIPERRLSAIREEQAKVEQELLDIAKELTSLNSSRETLQSEADVRLQETRYMEAKSGMGSAGKIIYLKGYSPAELIPSLQAAAKEHGWGLIIDEPNAADRVPSLVRLPKWVEPIQALFQAIDVLPGYWEIDASVAFLFFFSIFFGILVGDAGYGAIFLTLTFVARRKFRTAPSYPFWLLGILSISTVIWGVITGNYFGCGIPALDGLMKIPWLANERNLFVFCFLMGAIHLTIAHTWRVVVYGRSTRALAQIGWICLTWTMFFMAKLLVLGETGPGWIKYIFIAGVVAILADIIARFKEEWMALATLLFDVINNFVDVVSYIRLYAVGMASLAVAQAFNSLALGADGRIESVGAGIAAALILFAGHALNMVLCIMSVLVHGVRLNTLEFSGHIGLEWGGFSYTPFANSLKSKPEK